MEDDSKVTTLQGDGGGEGSRLFVNGSAGHARLRPNCSSSREAGLPLGVVLELELEVAGAGACGVAIVGDAGWQSRGKAGAGEVFVRIMHAGDEGSSPAHFIPRFAGRSGTRPTDLRSAPGPGPEGGVATQAGLEAGPQEIMQ